MNRREVIAGLAGAALAETPIARAQPPSKVWRIGFLSGIRRPSSIDSSYYGGFLRAMRDAGHLEGRDFIVDWQFAEEHAERLPELATHLVNSNVDIIVTTTAVTVEAARNATSTIPIVMTFAFDPITLGFVEGLAKPGGNVTGVSVVGPEVVMKQLEFLSAAVPTMRKLGGLTQRGVWKTFDPFVAVAAAAKTLGFAATRFDAENASQIDDAIAQMAAEGVDALLAFAIPTLTSHAGRMAELALKHRLPTMAAIREYATAGFLMSYGADVTRTVAQGAYYVDRIMKGSRPADLPVQQAATFDLAVNLKTAKALGLDLPASLLVRADEVIE